MRGKFRVVDKAGVKNWAESGSSALGDGGNIVSVAVVVFLEVHVEGDYGREALDVVANVDVGAPELLARDEGGLMGVLDLLVEVAGTGEAVHEKEHCLGSGTGRLHAYDSELAVKCQGRMVWCPEKGPDVALMSLGGLLMSPGEWAVTMASRRAAKAGLE